MAADESIKTIEKRFDSVGVENTELNRTRLELKLSQFSLHGSHVDVPGTGFNPHMVMGKQIRSGHGGCCDGALSLDCEVVFIVQALSRTSADRLSSVKSSISPCTAADNFREVELSGVEFN